MTGTMIAGIVSAVVGVVQGEPFETCFGVCVVVDFIGNDLLPAFPLWQLREHKPHLADGGRPDEPVPPTIGRLEGAFNS